MAHHPTVRRGVLLLAFSYAAMWAGISMTAGPGPSALVALTGRTAHAGLFFAGFALAAAAGSAGGGRAMDRWGRRPVLVAAHLLACVGYVALGLGVGMRSLPFFAAGLGALALGTGAAYLTRLAAGDLFPTELRGRGMAAVLFGATGGALLGPLLLVLGSGPLMGSFAGVHLVWFIAAPLPLVAATLVLLGPEPLAIARDLPRYHPIAAAPTLPTARAVILDAKALRPALVTGLVVLALAQAAMVGVMGVAGPVIEAGGHDVRIMAVVMGLHFVGMFGLSPIVGRIADRAGRRVAILAGIGGLASGGLVVATLPGVAAFAAGLFLIGLGWSFAYMGGTVLVADVTPLPRRARMMGVADFGASLLAAAGAVAGGIAYAFWGLLGAGVMAVALMLVPLAMAIALRERTPGAYGAEIRPNADADLVDAPRG